MKPAKQTAAAAALVGGLLALTGTAVGAGSASYGTAATAAHPQGVTQAGSYRHEFRGRITTANRSNSWFQLRTSHSGLVRIYVGRTTHWDNCNWGSMRVGRHVDVHAYRQHGSWFASSVGRWHGDWNDHWGDMGDDWGH